jgi:transposase-like protein
MLAGRGINVTYETIRCWANKFGPQIAANLKRRRQNSSPRWHLDEMVCSIKGERWYLWRAVDAEGVVLDLVLQRGRDKAAALKLLRKLLRNQPVKPELTTTDGLASYKAALDELKLRHLHQPGRLRENNRAENSHLPIRRRERKQQGFKSRSSAQRFLTTLAAVHNNFVTERHLNSRRYMRQLRERAAREWKIAAA